MNKQYDDYAMAGKEIHEDLLDVIDRVNRIAALADGVYKAACFGDDLSAGMVYAVCDAIADLRDKCLEIKL